MRIAAAVEYIGSQYSGWQRQHHTKTVQGHVEAALSQIANAPVEVTCAGRTDAGVHAYGQVIHFDTEAQRDNASWLFGVNALLPADISLRWIQPVSEDFHARYSAQHRSYRYVIHDQPARSALLHGRTAWSRYRLDAALMHQAGQLLLGEHDFSSFRASECQSKTANRNLMSLSVKRQQQRIYVDVCANAFLHHMVRNIVGVLMAVGAGKQPVNWAGEVLAARDRRRAGVTAPAAGLYFLYVSYPLTFDLPESAETEISLNL